MVKRYLFIFCLITFLHNLLFSQSDTLLLINPTVSKIKTVEFLVKEGIFPVEDFHFLGVYSIDENYDYRESELYISENNLKSFSLYGVQLTILAGQVFEANLCSDLFYHLFEQSKGAFFFGGPDIPPGIYSEHTNLLTNTTDPDRHYFEISFLYHLLGQNDDHGIIPFLKQKPEYLVNGICLGMQSINVATGGTLVQDIPSERYDMPYADMVISQSRHLIHRNYHNYLDYSDSVLTGYHFHQIIPLENSFIRNRMQFNSNAYPEVLSAHHQSINEPGIGITPAATSVDGKIIEAISHERFTNVFGVQFHPEKTYLFDSNEFLQVHSDSTINCNAFIKGTDSMSFHKRYWKMLAEILNCRNSSIQSR